VVEGERHPHGYLSPVLRKIDLTYTLPQTLLLLLDIWTLTVGTSMLSSPNVGNPMTLHNIPEKQISPPHTGESLKSHLHYLLCPQLFSSFNTTAISLVSR
jgi:hypothetical protein